MDKERFGRLIHEMRECEHVCAEAFKGDDSQFAKDYVRYQEGKQMAFTEVLMLLNEDFFETTWKIFIKE